MKTPDTFTVNGADGILKVELKHGLIVDVESWAFPVLWPSPYARIAKFDLAEFARSYPGEPLPGQTVSMSDLSFWTVDGEYGSTS